MAALFAHKFTGDLLLNSPVHMIEKSGGGGFTVHYSTGQSQKAVECSNVVIAMSPTAVHKHVKFTPALPIGHSKFLNQGMGHVIKAMVTFTSRWCKDTEDGKEY